MRPVYDCDWTDDHLREAAEKIARGEVSRVVVRASGYAVPLAEARAMGVESHVVFIRADGWTLGAPARFAGVAKRMWMLGAPDCRWVASYEVATGRLSRVRGGGVVFAAEDMIDDHEYVPLIHPDVDACCHEDYDLDWDVVEDPSCGKPRAQHVKVRPVECARGHMFDFVRVEGEQVFMECVRCGEVYKK